MSCTKPLVRLSTGQIIGVKTYLTRNGQYYQNLANSKEELWNEKRLLKMIREEEASLLPCGHCAGCKLAASAAWANRMEMELPYHQNAWFLTLTYDNENAPYRMTWDDLTGEVLTENLSLRYEDMQLFWKRLRDHIRYHKKSIGNLMYFQAGEYGGKTHRPHYHAIVYDLPIKQEDLKVYKKKNGAVYYNCAWIDKLWGLGFVVIAPAEWKAMAYTARYTTKKVYGKEGKEFYEGLGIIPEKCDMSKGIGKRYYEEHAEKIYADDKIQLKNGKICKPPRYFDKMFDRDHLPLNEKECGELEEVIEKAESDELKAIKRERRRLANDALFSQLKQSSISLQEYYTLKELKNQEKMKKLIRTEI